MVQGRVLPSRIVQAYVLAYQRFTSLGCVLQVGTDGVKPNSGSSCEGGIGAKSWIVDM